MELNILKSISSVSSNILIRPIEKFKLCMWLYYISLLLFHLMLYLRYSRQRRNLEQKRFCKSWCLLLRLGKGARGTESANIQLERVCVALLTCQQALDHCYSWSPPRGHKKSQQSPWLRTHLKSSVGGRKISLAVWGAQIADLKGKNLEDQISKWNRPNSRLGPVKSEADARKRPCGLLNSLTGVQWSSLCRISRPHRDQFSICALIRSQVIRMHIKASEALP